MNKVNIEDIELAIKNNAKELLEENQIGIEKMRFFMAGYCFGLYQNDIEINYDNSEKFSIYVEHKYKIDGNFATEHIIRFFSESDEDAFYNYFNDLEEFQNLSEEELKKLTKSYLI